MIRFSQYHFQEHQWANLSEISFELPLLQNHRGYCEKGANENTKDSILASFQAGFKMVEMDLRLNRDGKIILFHDPVRFQPHLKEASRFEEVMELLPRDCYYNLEIKNESKVNFSLEEKLIEFLKHHAKRNQVLFSSFNPFSLAWMSKLLPEIPRALLVTQEQEDGNSFFLRELSFLPLVKPHFLNLRWQDLDHYKEVPPERKVIWTLNDLAYAQNLLERKKVKSIITDSILPQSLGLK